MIFLGVGTNMGDKQKNIADAYQLLEDQQVKILRSSSIYRSEAWGIKDQDFFLNSVIEVEFHDEPSALLKVCLQVENHMGRKRIQKWGPRLIDLDIIDFHRQVWDTKDLKLPHPYYTKRSFVLVPLAELEPDWLVRASGRNIPWYLKQIPKEEACVRIDSR